MCNTLILHKRQSAQPDGAASIYLHYIVSRAEPNGVGDPLFDSSEAKVEYEIEIVK